jgi:hypothetical protein
MSNSQDSGRREIIRLSESAPKRQRTSRSTSKNTNSIPKEARPRVTQSAGIVANAELVVNSSERTSNPLRYRTATPVGDPHEATIEDAAVIDSPTRVIGSSERLGEAQSVRVIRTSDRESGARVTNSPTRVIDSSERCSGPEDIPEMAAS